MVLADQRSRLLAGVVEIVAAHGYDRASVESIVRAAGISRRTFYDLFPNKSEALLAAHAEALERLSTPLSEPPLLQADRTTQAVESLRAVLDWAAAEPEPALLVFAHPFVVGPHAAFCRDRFVERLAPVLRQLRRASAVELDPVWEEGLLGGLAELVSSRLIDGRAAALPTLAPLLIEFALGPYLSRGEARTFAL